MYLLVAREIQIRRKKKKRDHDACRGDACMELVPHVLVLVNNCSRTGRVNTFLRVSFFSTVAPRSHHREHEISVFCGCFVEFLLKDDDVAAYLSFKVLYVRYDTIPSSVSAKRNVPTDKGLIGLSVVMRT